MRDTGISNRDFIERHAAPGRIGLCTGNEWMSDWIRKAQAPLTHDGHRSLWSHAFIFNERRVDGHWWVIESDLDVRYKHIRLGVQENRASRYYDAEEVPNIAILDFGLDEEQVKCIQVAALELLAGGSFYSITELMGLMVSLPSRRLRKRNNFLSQRGALFCSAMVNHCYSAADMHLLPDVHGKHITPNDIACCPRQHTAHRLVRDLGVSSVRHLTHETIDLLNTPVSELF